VLVALREITTVVLSYQTPQKISELFTDCVSEIFIIKLLLFVHQIFTDEAGELFSPFILTNDM